MLQSLYFYLMFYWISSRNEIIKRLSVMLRQSVNVISYTLFEIFYIIVANYR